MGQDISGEVIGRQACDAARPVRDCHRRRSSGYQSGSSSLPDMAKHEGLR